MRRILQTFALSLFPVLAFSLVVPGCGKKDEGTPKGSGTPPVTEKKADPTPEKKEVAVDTKKAIDAKLDAVVTGKVTIDGAKPEPKVVAAMADHADTKVCRCDEAQK